MFGVQLLDMGKKTNQIKFPIGIGYHLLQLQSEHLLTSTFFSYWLTKQFLHFQTASFDETQAIGEGFTSTVINESELHCHALEVVPTVHDNTYIVHFPGNGQNALDLEYIQRHVKEAPTSTHVFWNYPEIGERLDSHHNARDWFDAGYQQVKRLIDRPDNPVAAKNIIIESWSMGCAPAAYAARRLYEEGSNVSLIMDRGFISSITALQAQLVHHLQAKKYATLVSSSLSTGFAGLVLASFVARFFATIGLILGGGVAGCGYLVGQVLQSIGNSLGEYLGDWIAVSFQFIGWMLNTALGQLGVCISTLINVLASIVDAALSVACFIIGASLGLIVGCFVSLGQIFGYEPVIVPITQTLGTWLSIMSLQMDALSELKLLVNTTTYHVHGVDKITAINTVDDWVVKPEAAISSALSGPRFFRGIKTVWFNEGSHGNALASPLAPTSPDTTHVTLVQNLVLAAPLPSPSPSPSRSPSPLQ